MASERQSDGVFGNTQNIVEEVVLGDRRVARRTGWRRDLSTQTSVSSSREASASRAFSMDLDIAGLSTKSKMDLSDGILNGGDGATSVSEGPKSVLFGLIAVGVGA